MFNLRGEKGYRSQPHIRVPTFLLSTPLGINIIVDKS